MTAPICAIDTETDGVHPGRRVWEVAVIRRDEHGQTEQSWFVEIDLSTADPFGLRVGRFYDRHPLGRYLAGLQALDKAKKDVYSTQSTARTVARMTHGAHLVGAVPSFDAEVLGRLLREHGLTPAWHYHLIDVEALPVGYLNGLRAAGLLDKPIPRDRPAHESAGEYLRDLRWRTAAKDIATSLPWNSDALSRACGVEPASDEERHTALGDARHVMRWYDAITGGAS